MLIEQPVARQGEGQYGALNRQKAHFRSNAAARRKPPEFATGSQDSVTGNNKREGIAAESFADGPGHSWLSELRRDFTV